MRPAFKAPLVAVLVALTLIGVASCRVPTRLQASPYIPHKCHGHHCITPTPSPTTTSVPATTTPVTTAPPPTTTTAPVTTSATPTATTPTPTPTLTESSAAQLYGWGAPRWSDEFNYTGAPDSTKWNLYNSAGQGGKGLRVPAQDTVNGSSLIITGLSNGTTGGMSTKDRGITYGRWEARMKVPSRDTEYHPVLILWPDTAQSTCPEIDYSESTTSVTVDKFFLHYGCGGVQVSSQTTLDMTQWHDYAVEWTSDHVTGYIDGQVWFTDTTHVPTVPMHQTIQLDWFPDGTTTAVSSMQVDWVRAYGLGSTPTPTPTVTTPTPTPTVTTPTPTPTTPTPTPTPTVTGSSVMKVLTIIEENHSLSQMESGMPYTFGLAKQYGYATNYTAITHPSLPNYIAISSGKTYGITDDNAPSSHPLSGASVFGQALTAGKSAKVYAEGATSNCMLSNTGRYAVKHNPWAYFVDERTQCVAHDVPVTQLSGDITGGTLPNVGLVIPDLCNDAHDCSLTTADAWVKGYMQQVFNGPDWKSGHLLVIVTADEDDKASGNKVLTVAIHPSLSGKVTSTALTHYSLTRLYEDVAHATYLNGAASANSLSAAFGLTVG